MRRTVTAASMALALAAAGVLAGCGGSSSGAGAGGGAAAGSPAPAAESSQSSQAASPQRAIAAAYSSTAAASSMKIAVKGTIDVQGKHLSISGHGAADLPARKVDLTMTLGQLGDIRMREIGNTVYEKLPPSALPGGSPYAGRWIKITLPAGASGQAAGSFDPQQALSFLKDVSDGGVKRVGTTTVDGTPTTHYSAQIDLSKALQKAQQQLHSAGSTPNLNLTQLAHQLGRSQLPIDVYIDGKHLLRRVTMSMQVPVPSAASTASGAGSGSSGQASFSVTEDFSDYGSPVQISAPPAGQVVDGSSLLGGGSGGGGARGTVSS